jgi:hypothetical protein
MQRHTALSYCLAFASASTPAPARPATHAPPIVPPSRVFGRGGQVAISAERLFGISDTSLRGSDSHVARLSLFGPSGYELLFAPYAIPRLAMDGFVCDGLSLGFGANLAHLAGSGGFDGITVLGLFPRLGYAATAGSAAAVWPRLGVSYLRISNDSDEAAHYELAMTVEVPIIARTQHYGFIFGPVADIGLSATNDRSVDHYGLLGGLIVWF